MNEGTPTTVKVLREQLVNARQERDLGLLRDVEEGLRQLGKIGYRCCLVDFDSCRLRYYVRLLGYEQARVKAQIEFPISQEVAPVQWLPLSHLADYGGGRKCPKHSPHIRGWPTTSNTSRRRCKWERWLSTGLGGRPPKRLQRRARNRVWFYLGGLVVLAALAGLIAWRMLVVMLQEMSSTSRSSCVDIALGILGAIGCSQNFSDQEPAAAMAERGFTARSTTPTSTTPAYLFGSGERATGSGAAQRGGSQGLGGAAAVQFHAGGPIRPTRTGWRSDAGHIFLWPRDKVEA